jgi:inorganic pyrophosphatase
MSIREKHLSYKQKYLNLSKIINQNGGLEKKSINNTNDQEILVYVEISKNSRIKYEFDHELNALICDRVLPTPFYFPFNYGFVPNTLSGDGDPLDAIIYMEEELVVNSYIKCRIIGGLETIDENGEDTKIIFVPLKKVSFIESNIESIDDLPEHFIEKVKFFYEHYKDMEKGKHVKIGKILSKKEAIKSYIKTCIKSK